MYKIANVNFAFPNNSHLFYLLSCLLKYFREVNWRVEAWEALALHSFNWFFLRFGQFWSLKDSNPFWNSISTCIYLCYPHVSILNPVEILKTFDWAKSTTTRLIFLFISAPSYLIHISPAISHFSTTFSIPSCSPCFINTLQVSVYY